MPRFHRINNTRVQFTAEEETARDTEEAAAQTARAAGLTRDARREVLLAKVDDGSITHAEMVELMQLNRQ